MDEMNLRVHNVCLLFFSQFLLIFLPSPFRYAENGGYEKAIIDLEAALKLNPNHVNGRKYLAETLVAFGKL